MIFKEVGVCEVDISKLRNKWNLLCRIVNYKDEYKFVELTLRGRTKLKVSISEKDAKDIIFYLNLKEVRSDVFANGTTYLTV